ncbi:MAG: DnaD domain protein [Velocimicrobium sp.]
MDRITLCTSSDLDATVVSNVFIDSYMPAANGSYVKVYLYLLRCLSGHVKDFSISYLADRLDDTEKDIVRALKYWEKVQLIKLSNNGSGNITSITLKEPNTINTHLEPAVYKENEPASNELTATATDSLLANTYACDISERPTYTTAQITELTNNDEIKWIMNIIELYLESPLKPKDIQLILYLYESLSFSPELIMFLYEYCISKSKKNTSYIEAVALSWAEQGIKTVEEAETANILYNSNYTSVSKAFGLNRAPGTVEKKYIDKWMTKYGLEINIIVEACNRTILNTQKADFKYADKILENWSHNKVKRLDDIKKLDSQFNAIKNVKQSAASSHDAVPKPVNNRFNAFPQRNYSKKDYEDIEKRLLNRQ